MNYSALLSTLLLSTLVPDLTAKSTIARRSAEVEPHSYDFDIKVEATDRLLIVFNSTSNAALIVDSLNPYFVILNGEGKGIAVNVTSTHGCMIDLDAKNSAGWSETLEFIEKAFTEPVSCPDDHKFHTMTVSDDAVLDLVHSIVVDFVMPLAEHNLNMDGKKIALELILSIADRLSIVQQRTNMGLPMVIGNKTLSLHVDVPGFLNILWTLDDIHVRLNENLKTLQEKGVEMDISKTYGAPNGWLAFTDFIRLVGSKISLKPLNSYFQDVEAAANFLSGVGGNILYGLPAPRPLVSIMNYYNETTTLDVVVNYFVHYLTWTRLLGPVDYREEMKTNYDLILGAIKSVNAKDDLKGLVNIAENMKAGTLQFRGVDLSKILDLLMDELAKPSEKPLAVLCNIFDLIDGRNVPKSVAFTMAVLIGKLVSPNGIMQVAALGIDLEVDSVAEIRETIQEAIGDELKTVSGSGLYDFLSGLPIVKNIVKAMDEAHKETGNKGTLKELFGNNTEVDLDLVKGALGHVVVLDPGVDTMILSKAGHLVYEANNIGESVHTVLF